MQQDEIIFEGKRYIVADAAAKESGRTREYLMTQCRLGKLEGRRIGRVWYIDHASLIAFVDDQQRALERHYQKLSEERAEEYNAHQLVSAIEHTPEKDQTEISSAASEPLVRENVPVAPPRHIMSFFSAEGAVLILLMMFISSAGLLSWYARGGDGFTVFGGTPILEKLSGMFSFSRNDPSPPGTPPHQEGFAQQTINNNEYNTTNVYDTSTTNNNNYNSYLTTTKVEGLNEGVLSARIKALDDTLTERMYSLVSANTTNITQVYQTLGAVARGDNFNDIKVTDSAWTEGSITDATISGGTITGATSISAGSLTLSNPLGVSSGGTGVGSYTAGDILYASSTDTLAKLSVGTNGQLLSITNGIPSWSSLAGSGSIGVWATTSDSLAIYTADSSDVVLIGASATTTTGNIFETLGNSLFRGTLTSYNTVTASSFTATSTSVTSQFINASSTALSALDYLAVGRTATTTIRGNTSTSTFSGPIASVSGNLELGGFTSSDNLILNRYGGNVGVGTSSPWTKLGVVGTTTITNGGILLDNGQDLFWRNSANSAYTSVLELSGDTTILRGGGGTPTLDIQSSTGSSLATFLEGGNVGIGTTSPYAKLSVVGETVASHFTATTTATSTFPTLSITGRLYDSAGTGGTNGQILQTTGSATQWAATSSLNIALSNTTGTLPETRGGTNQTSYTTGDVLYSSVANVLSKLGIGTGGFVLGSVNGVPGWVATTTFSSGLTYAGGNVILDWMFPSNATTTQIAFNGGLTAAGATTSALAVTGSSTISSVLNVSGALNANSTLTALGNSSLKQATSTNFAISSISSDSLLKTTTGGAVIAAVAGIDYVTGAGLTAAYPFALAGNATSTLTQFNGGLTSFASSTIGNGTQAGGLTIFGGATTTGNLLVQGGATTTSFAVSGITSSLLKTDGNGSLLAAVAGTDYAAASSVFAFPWSATTNYGAAGNSTSTPIWFQQGLQASSTSQIAYASTTAITATTASTTNLIASNSFTLASLTGFLKATAGVVATSLIDLTSDITGILGVTNGGTGWGDIQANSIVLGNGAGALATTTAGTNGQVLALANGVPTWTATTPFSGGLTYANGSVTLDWMFPGNTV